MQQIKDIRSRINIFTPSYIILQEIKRDNIRIKTSSRAIKYTVCIKNNSNKSRIEKEHWDQSIQTVYRYYKRATQFYWIKRINSREKIISRFECVSKRKRFWYGIECKNWMEQFLPELLLKVVRKGYDRWKIASWGKSLVGDICVNAFLRYSPKNINS